MGKAWWKDRFKDIDFVGQMNIPSGESIVLYNRSTEILEEMVGRRIDIYTGARFISLTVNWDMIGQKVGEFAPTRKKPIHKEKKKKK